MKIQACTTLLAAALLALPVTSARADSAPAEPVPLIPAAASQGTDTVPQPEPPPIWYGYKLLIADAASIGAIVLGVGGDLAPVGIPGVIGLFAAAPTVHFAEGQSGRALGSLGLRLGLPLAGGAIAMWLHRDNKNADCDCMGGVVAGAGGMALGLLGAMAIDAAFLGWRPRPTTEKSVALVPSIAIGPGGGSFGLAGRF